MDRDHFRIMMVLCGTILLSLGTYQICKVIKDRDNKYNQDSNQQATTNQSKQSKQQDCLVEALWHEARSESYAGMKAIAEVVHNRARTTNETICEVIKKPWQFSYRNRLPDGYKLDPEKITNLLDLQAYRLASMVASEPYTRFLGNDVLWYTTTAVRPKWSSSMTVIGTIGSHRFYSK